MCHISISAGQNEKLVPTSIMTSLEYLGNPLHYFRHFFNIGYCLGVIPFRFKLNNEKNCYEIVRNPWQKALCFIIYGMAVMEELRYIRDLMKEIQGVDDDGSKKGQDGLSYFKIAYIGSEILCFFTIIVTFWFRDKCFLNAMNLMHKKSFESIKSIANAQLWTPIALVILFLNTALIFLQIFSTRGWDIVAIGEAWTKDGVRLLFLDSFLLPPSHSALGTPDRVALADGEYTEAEWEAVFAESAAGGAGVTNGDGSSSPPHHQYNLYNNIIFNIFFKLLLSISIIALLFVLTLGKILLLNSMFCLNSVVNECKDKVYWRCLSSTDVLIEYKELEEITHSINKAVGLLIFGSIMAMLPYFVTGLVDLMSPDTNIFAFANHILEITHLFTFLIFSSAINKRASKIEEWILETQDLSHLPFQDFNILIHKISQSNICFDAAGFFKVNNGFLGKIIGLLLTFAVIFIQFKTT